MFCFFFYNRRKMIVLFVGMQVDMVGFRDNSLLVISEKDCVVVLKQSY